MKKFLLTLSIALLTIIASAQVSITVNVLTAGGLSAALTAAGVDANTVTSLTVTGNINASDIQFMNAMPLLEAFDLEATTIEGDYYNANKFPDRAFKDNKRIKSIKLPKNITVIGSSAFENCTSLTCTLSIPNTVTNIYYNAFKGCAGLIGPLVIPNSVKLISSYAFCDCKGFTGTLTIPNSVTRLANDVFWGCSGFTGDLIIPNSLTEIGSGTFGCCYGMKGKLVIPSSVTLIEDLAFSHSGFTGDLIIPNSVTTIERLAFWDCKGFISLTLPNALKTIEEKVFSDCSGLKGILSIPSSVTSIGVEAFSDCYRLTGNLTIPESVTTIGSGAFVRCTGLNGSLTIPPSTTSIGQGAFSNCSKLTGSLQIPSSVTIIDKYVFMGCSGFSGLLTIPSSITSIGDYSFSGCTGINKINVGISTPLPITQYTFEAINKTTCQLIVPIGATTSYRAANYWKDFANITEQALVIFNPQDGMPVPDCFTITNLKITSPVTSRVGYSFAGWHKEAACTNAWNFATDLVAGNMTLYAKWNINSYTINFDSQGGSAVTPISTNYNTTISAPTPPTRTGYTFDYWCQEPACTTPWNFTTDVVTNNTKLYAKWNINKYTVSFNYQNGGTVLGITANHGATITSPVNPTRTGYTFIAWYKEAACTNPWNFSTNVITANTTLYAKWNINSYTVTFNTQGGDIIANINANYNTTITIPVAPTRMGYTFNGWYKETACTNAWNFATDKITANTTLFAKWTINTYTVTFNSDGGTPVSSITTNYFTKIGEPTPPSKTGYTFDGWYQNISDAFSFNFSLYFITSDLTLTAKWTPITYGVSFYSEGISINYRGVEYNTTITNKPEDPTRTGYIFNGWYKESTFNTLWNFATDKVIADTKLYAKWTAITYSVTFDSQGGSPVTSIVVKHGTKISEPTPPTRKGYTLKGWYDQPTNGFTFFFDYTQITADITLYAQWTINRYSITFDSKGGTAVASQTVDYNSPIYAPTPPTRTGYTFDGWFKDEALTSAWNFATDVVSDNATLYAKWNAAVYNVIFNSQGGSAVSNVNVNHGKTLTRPADPTRTGYTFAGWYKDANCTTAWNFATDVVTKATTLYAKWNINTYTVSFNAQGGSSIADVTCDYNNTIAEPLAPTRIGYTFAGWYKEYNYITAWNFATDLVSNNTTLYAKWSINIYTVNFESQGGNAIASISATYNTTISAPTPPTKTGFTFVGWYKETACTNAWLFATDLVTVNMSLYAKWDLSNSVSSTSTEDFRLYPNPADDFVTLEGSNMKQASIFNLMGTMIIQLDIKGNDTTTINVGKLISGNYFIYVKTNDGKVVILKMLKL